MRVTIESYGNYSSDNYGSNAMLVTVGDLELWFSYKTIVAFRDYVGLHVTRNYWGTTTGKHLNWIDGGDKAARLDSTEFDAELARCMARHNLTPESVAVR